MAKIFPFADISTLSDASSAEVGELFEQRCLDLLDAMGYSVTRTGRSGDGGIDLRARDTRPITGGTLIIQRKAWEAPVGEPVLRDLFGLVVSEGANKGVIIASSRFTESAYRFAGGKPLELIDGEMLKKLETEHPDEEQP